MSYSEGLASAAATAAVATADDLTASFLALLLGVAAIMLSYLSSFTNCFLELPVLQAVPGCGAGRGDSVHEWPGTRPWSAGGGVMAEVEAGNARNFLEGVAADRGIEAAVIAVENASVFWDQSVRGLKVGFRVCKKR